MPALLEFTVAAGSVLRAQGLLGPPPDLPRSVQPALWLAAVVLGPVFEELLFRGELFSVLGRAFGVPAAIALSAVLFALPHIEPWHVLGAALAGVVLGTLRWASRSLLVCIGLHAGWNLAALAAGAAPQARLPAGAGLAVGSVLLAVSLCLARRSRLSGFACVARRRCAG